MILIADSGSTKCDWAVLNADGDFVLKTRTLGLNPNLLTTQMMHKRLAKSDELAHIKDDINHIYFYGAGCGTEQNKARLNRFLKKYFRHAKSETHEDLLGACLAVAKKPGITCILGTGSNACYFDGKRAVSNTPSLGYMIMDEASGNYFGKQLLRDYFYKKMPTAIAKRFESAFPLYPHQINESLYKGDNPSAYLAEFAGFMFKEATLSPYFKNLLSKGLRIFIENHVLTFSEAKTQPIHFVGSIAYFSKEIIPEVLEDYNLTLGNILRHPIDGLLEHFQQRIKV